MLKKRISESTHAAVQRWLPPVAIGLLKRYFGSVRFEGDFPTWAAAVAECSGYDDAAIIDRVKDAALLVREGRAAYERDGLSFQDEAYVWPVLSSLLWAAARNGGNLSVLDFGGSLGSTYFQHRKWFEGLGRFKWSIVEQPSFVKVGRERFEDGTLKFYDDVAAALAAEPASVLLASGVFQYLPDPYARLEELSAAGFDVIVLDRLSLSLEGRDRLTIQRVGERIYPASYPAWFFDRTKFLAAFKEYRIVDEFQPLDRANVPSTYVGLLLKRVDRR